MAKKVTLKDIAEKAGVSTATVSMILNNKTSRISDKKKEEVKSIAKELNYIPNQAARSLSLQTTQTIGLIVPDLNNPFFSSLCKSIEEKLQKKGYFTFIVNSHDTRSYDFELINKLQQRQVDGLLLCLSNENYNDLDTTYQLLDGIQIPYVLIDRLFPNLNLDSWSVSFDHYQGGYLAGEYLAHHTHKSLACLMSSKKTYASQQRLAGFKQALKNHNQSDRKTITIEGEFSVESGYQMTEYLAKSNNLANLGGVFAFNDLIAYGFIKYLIEHKIKFDYSSIVGYDNLKMSNIFGYGFPSVVQDIEMLADKSCQLLLQQLENSRMKPHQDLLEVKLNTLNK